MKRERHSRFKSGSRLGILLLLGIFIFSFAGCESIFGPKTEETDSTDDEGEARILITNMYGETLDIYMDGKIQFSLAHKNSDKIRNVTLDEHDLEAKLPASGTVVDSETIDVVDYSDYSWTIDDPPDIKVTNAYGKTLKIYMDGKFLFELLDEEDRWIMNVDMGDRFLKAVKSSDDKEVASTTISVTANKDYTWLIQ